MINQENFKKSQSSQNLKDLNERLYQGRKSYQEEDLRLPHIGKRQNETSKDNHGRRTSAGDKPKWSEGSRKRSVSNPEDPSNSPRWSNENALSLGTTFRPTTSNYHKLPLKDSQNEENETTDLSGESYGHQIVQSQKTIDEHYEKQTEISKLRELVSPLGTKKDDQSESILLKTKMKNGKSITISSKRDNDLTARSGTISSLYNSNGRELESIFSHTFESMNIVSQPQIGHSSTSSGVDALPNQTIVPTKHSPVKGENPNGTLSMARHSKGVPLRNRKKDLAKKFDKSRDIDNGIVQKVRVHESLVKDKKYTLGKISFNRLGNLQRLDRPSSNLREHIRREEARYNQYQNEMKRLMFEKWLQETNEYLYQIRHEK